MAKHLNVSLGFTADASQAKRELQSLQRSLNDLVKNSSITKDDLGLVNEIQGATRAAAQLAVQLKNATNVNTGNLDLTKFSDAMKSSGMTLDRAKKTACRILLMRWGGRPTSTAFLAASMM